MRVISCTVAMVTCLVVSSYAQTAGAVYAELAGPGYFYSVNAELPVAEGSDVDGSNASATVGYRHARSGGLFFQVAATPAFDDHRIYPWAGISVGKSY
jgi:hypothetical protein